MTEVPLTRPTPIPSMGDVGWSMAPTYGEATADQNARRFVVDIGLCKAGEGRDLVTNGRIYRRDDATGEVSAFSERGAA